MPICPEHRFFYPIDWPRLSHEIRFVRAKGHCEQCGRPHGRVVLHLGDDRWWARTLGAGAATAADSSRHSRQQRRSRAPGEPVRGQATEPAATIRSRGAVVQGRLRYAMA